jgi:hypothetical protein
VATQIVKRISLYEKKISIAIKQNILHSKNPLPFADKHSCKRNPLHLITFLYIKNNLLVEIDVHVNRN